MQLLVITVALIKSPSNQTYFTLYCVVAVYQRLQLQLMVLSSRVSAGRIIPLNLNWTVNEDNKSQTNRFFIVIQTTY